ncbi:MAG TPA: hypothetical protein VND88_11225 [Candidatus Acidoferrales bacterium]|nr:hypothetical protein [Candidatus Acidoferrales bacterium]
MAFCTIVEWDHDLGAELSKLQGDDAPPPGSLVRVYGSTGSGTYAIEVWESGEDARRFAESTAPALAASSLPRPDRVAGFAASKAFIRGEQ